MPPVVAAVAAVGSMVAGTIAAGALAAGFVGIGLTWAAVSIGLTIGASMLTKGGRNSQTAPSPENVNRLRANIDVRTPRKTAIGKTALATDIRDEEFTASQSLMHRFIVTSSHKITSHDEVWFDDKLVWTATGGVVSEFAAWLQIQSVTEGSAANAIYVSSRMGSSRRYTGCSYIYIRYMIGDEQSPFAQSVTSRITIKGKAASLYDPRRDSTVAGGSGSQRADNQATWVWDDNACRNPALALLFYLLGWRINGQLAVGKGIPKERIDLESFAIAANICDEMVSTGGGTEPRYRCDGVWSEGDSPTTVIDTLKSCMNADLDDVDGKLRLTIFTDTTFASDADFIDDDIIGKFTWEPHRPLESSFNVVRGVYTDPSDQSLYQQVDYPEVRVSSPDGIDRIDTFNLPMVESPYQAQRLAELRRLRQVHGGIFKADFQATAWRVQKNSIVRLTFSRLGFVNKTFRVAEIDLRVDGVVPLTLVEENPAIYVAPAFKPAIVATSTTPYDPFLNPIQAGVTAALALAQARGKLTVGGPCPSAANSNVGDTHIDDAGIFYDRVESGGILLGGFAITLAGFRPQLVWTPSAVQPLRDTINQANSAQAAAAAANAELAVIASDNVLSRVEKPAVLLDVQAINDEQIGIGAQATAYGITTEKTSYDTAISALNSYLTGLTSPTLWSNPAGDTMIVAATFRSKFADVYAARQALLNKIAAVAGTLAGWSGITGAGKPEDNADVTSAITGQAVVSIAADYTGAVSATLPRGVQFALNRNGVDVTTSATWSVAVVSGTISASIGAATGLLSLNTSGGALTDSVLTITAVYGATTRTMAVRVVKELAPAPNTGGGGSGSSGSASGTIAGSSPSSSMTAVGPELTVTTGSAGKVGLSASFNFDTATGSGNFGLAAQWYRWNGSAYVALGSETAALSNYSRFAGEPGDPGYGECSFLATGLGASSVEKFRLYARNTVSNLSVPRNVYGTCLAMGS